MDITAAQRSNCDIGKERNWTLCNRVRTFRRLRVRGRGTGENPLISQNRHTGLIQLRDGFRYKQYKQKRHRPGSLPVPFFASMRRYGSIYKADKGTSLFCSTAHGLASPIHSQLCPEYLLSFSSSVQDLKSASQRRRLLPQKATRLQSLPGRWTRQTAQTVSLTSKATSPTPTTLSMPL